MSILSRAFNIYDIKKRYNIWNRWVIAKWSVKSVAGYNTQSLSSSGSGICKMSRKVLAAVCYRQANRRISNGKTEISRLEASRIRTYTYARHTNPRNIHDSSLRKWCFTPIECAIVKWRKRPDTYLKVKRKYWYFFYLRSHEQFVFQQYFFPTKGCRSDTVQLFISRAKPMIAN